MDKKTFQINVLPVGVGDCIHLRFFSKNKWYNIIVDAGPGEYAEQFLNLLLHIGEKEQVDLLCFTHIDDDHIRAAEMVFANHKEIGEIIEKIWINIPEYERKQANSLEPGLGEDISIKNALKLYRHILWFEENKLLECKTCILAGESLTFGDVLVTAVLPYEKRLKKLETWWVKKRPYESSDEDISTVSSDRSETNGSSIVLQVDTCGKKMLFAGDAFAVDLYKMAKAQGTAYDLVKLPHHGSRANITLRMLNAMKCLHFIISADGTCGRPAQGTLDILAQYGKARGGVTLYGNHEWSGFDDVDGVAIIPLSEEPVQSMEGISIRTEAIRL